MSAEDLLTSLTADPAASTPTHQAVLRKTRLAVTQSVAANASELQETAADVKA